MAWRIDISVTARTRAQAEAEAATLLRVAQVSSEGGLVREGDGYSLACGDPGPERAPGDLSIAGEGEVAEWRERG